MFQEIPSSRPQTPLLDSLNEPADLRQLKADQLPRVAHELREFLLYSVGQSGGHFGAGLGVVELTIALHYVYDTPNDLLLWDVGHQAYPHKILTGRREQLPTIRSKDGLSPFPKRSESPYDTFGVGHSSTSISAALGMAIAAKKQGKDKKVAAIIGDGAMTAGMAFEAMNHAGHDNSDMLVILNDNDMSISENVGGLNKYLSKILSSKTYASMREGSRKVLSTIPHVWELASKTEEHVKGFFTPGMLFEELGFNYIGPVDGHDLPSLVKTLENMRRLKGPQFLHVITKKGKGFAPAEADQIKYHALSPAPKPQADAKPVVKRPTFSNVFGRWICDAAAHDNKLLAITPAMREGSDLVKFSERFPDRYFDVAIAEQHAVTLAAGMACEGAKPVVAIYSTFLQRAYDQLVHDVALQNLDVTFAIDRAGVVGADGPTHAGAYDISFMRCIPNMVIATPSDELECRLLLQTAYEFEGPAAVRYPRGSGTGVDAGSAFDTVEIGKGRVVRQGTGVAILCFGPLLQEALKAAETHNATVVDMRFVKPLDHGLLQTLSETHTGFITLEDNAIMGGAGSAVSEYLLSQNIKHPTIHLGIPDGYIEHASQAQQWAEMGIDAAGIERALARLN